jgi:hypothetical protein
MIKKSILIAVVLLLVFEAFIRFSNIQWDTSQNDKSANLISAQKFIYNFPQAEVAKDTVIIGSSISRKLVTDSLGSNFINLAFNAWSSYDGLQLVRLTQKKPACLLIEMNVVGNQVIQEDVASSLSPVSYYPNKYFKSFQLQNQPVGLMIGYFKELLKARMEAMRAQKRENQALYDLNIKMEKEKLVNTLPDSIFNKRFVVLKELISGFKQQGIAIVFFEVPFDEQLMNTETVLKTRAYFHQYFPDAEYKYIDIPPVNDFIYSDGIHLSIKSAISYTRYLKESLNNIKSTK